MIVFSDMDGTLLTSDKQMSDATWAMLDELARRGGMRWAMPRSSGRLKMHVAREASMGVPASSCQTLAPLAQTA